MPKRPSKRPVGSTKKARIPRRPLTFGDIFFAQEQFALLLAPFITTLDARKVRLLDKRSRELVRKHPWTDKTTVVTQLQRWRVCFPIAPVLRLSTHRMSKSRDYMGLKGVVELIVEIDKRCPNRLLRYADELDDLEIINGTSNPYILDSCDRSFANIYAQVTNSHMFAISRVYDVVVIPNSPIYDGYMFWLNSQLTALNVSGCTRLTDRGFENLRCSKLVCINISNTQISDDGLMSIKNAHLLKVVVFGNNPNITDAVLDRLTGLEYINVYRNESPFTAAAYAALARRGVGVFEIG